MKTFFIKAGSVILGISILTLFLCVLLQLFGAVKFQGYLVSKDRAVAAVTTQGFQDVTVVKRNCSFMGMRGGDKKDDVRFTVEATNPLGKRVTVYVYAGWPFKAATIRMP